MQPPNLLDSASAARLAARYGTPLYVYDLDVVDAKVAEVRAAFPSAALRYAVKANPAAAVLSRLSELGVGVEAITVGEYARSLRAGVPRSAALLGGPAQDAALRRLALAMPPEFVSLDSEGTFQGWLESGLPSGTRFFVRVNPELDPATHPHLATGDAGSKFGLAPQRALALAHEVDRIGLFAGFHVHAGSQIRDVRVHRDVLAVLDGLYREFPNARHIDLGGGFAVPGSDLPALAALINPWVAERRLELVLEPGRMLVAEAGTLLTRVLHVKEGVRHHWIADAGMADLLRPALYDAEHPIALIDEGRGAATPATAADTTPTDLDGPLCENGDRLARGLQLGPGRPQQLIAVGLAGAYGWTMGSWYASHTRVGEVALQGGRDWRIRDSERVHELWAGEAAPSSRLAPGTLRPAQQRGPRGTELAGALLTEVFEQPGEWALCAQLADGSELCAGADEVRPAASVIKLLLLACALDPASPLELAERVEIQRSDYAGGSGVLHTLDVGLRPTWRDLLRLMITHSDNLATNMVLERLGLDRVNAWAEAHALHETRMAGPLQVNPERWTEAQRRGERARTTAAESARLLRGLCDPNLGWFGAETTRWAQQLLRETFYRDGLLRRLEPDELVGSKGGWISTVRNEVACWWDSEGRWRGTLAVMCSEHPELGERFEHGTLQALGRLGQALHRMLARSA